MIVQAGIMYGIEGMNEYSCNNNNDENKINEYCYCNNDRNKRI